MSGPKHLWSGDWQHESAAASDELADRRPKAPDPEPTATRPRPPARKQPGRTRRVLLIALPVVLVLAVGAWALTSLGGSSGPRPSTAAGQPSLPGTTPSFSPSATVPTVPSVTPASNLPRPVYWLGMEVQTVPPGAAVIETVGQSSPAGLAPGDVIVSVNNRPINGTSDIARAIQGLGAGDVVPLQVSHGSGLYGTEVTLASPPSLYP